MNSIYTDNFGNRFDKRSDNFLRKPVIEMNSFKTSLTPPKIDLGIAQTNRLNIDSNGYGLNETTSLGFTPNPIIEKKDFGGGLLPPNQGNSNYCNQQDFGNGMLPPNYGQLNNHYIGNPITSPVFAGVSQNGYFAPNADFMKPAVSKPLNINMPMHP